MVGETRPAIAGSEDARAGAEERGPEPRSEGRLQRLGKARKWMPPVSRVEGNAVLLHLGFSLARPVLDF